MFHPLGTACVCDVGIFTGKGRCCALVPNHKFLLHSVGLARNIVRSVKGRGSVPSSQCFQQQIS